MAKIYLAAAFSRQKEMCGYRGQLAARGHKVTSRWVDHHGPDSMLEPREKAVACANVDIADLLEAEVVIIFTGVPSTRGGYHTELGIVIGSSTPRHVFIVGPRENIFQSMPGIEQFDTWNQALAHSLL